MALIRSACLASQDRWSHPTCRELSDVIDVVRSRAHAGRLMSESAAYWLAIDPIARTRDVPWPIPYAPWAELCQLAGLGDISLDGVAHNLLTQ